MAEARILTVDNGGTKTRVARYGERIERLKTYTTPRDCNRAVGRIVTTARVVLNGRRPDAVGISVAGKVEDGRIVSAGKLQEYGWVGHEFVAHLAEELDISPDLIVFLNDSRAGGNAERIARRPKKGKMSAFMTLSTGLGGALYTKDTVIPDEPGHEHLRVGVTCSCGKVGHMEAHFGGEGIKRKFGVPAEDIPHDDPRWDEIKGDFHLGIRRTLARYEVEHEARLQTIGFTGSVALGGPKMLSGLQHYLDAHLSYAAPTIEEAVYGDESGLYGAAFAADEMLQAA